LPALCEILLHVITEAAVSYEWRGAAEELELDWLHAEAFDHPPTPAQWQRQLENHSLGWVCARLDEELVGFANVIWDGGAHAVLLDTMVLPGEQRQGIGAEIVRVAAEEARRSGCEWLHADFERAVAAFYLEQCGFTPTEAGLLNLRARVADEPEEE
jgi:GNAT superfamily N-acetyltransferase